MLWFWLSALVAGINHALEVSNGSSCAGVCEGPTLTFGTDLLCADDGYTTLDKGQLMKSCLECESNSAYVDSSVAAPQDNDQYWLLFNAKYTLQYCLTQTTDGTPNFSDCESKCAGLFPALTASWFATPRPAQYDYCTIQDNAFTDYINDCASCLQSGKGSVVLGNLLVLMKSGCDSRADAHSGNTIPIQRELFDTELVAVTTALSSSATSTKTSISSSAATTNPPSSTQATSISEGAAASGVASKVSGGLSPGAAAGIGVSCGLGALALGVFLFWYIRRRRNTVRVPRSMVDQPVHYDNKPAYGHSYSDHPPENATGAGSPVEMNGHNGYEMDHNQRFEMGTNDPTQSATFTSELDSRPVASGAALDFVHLARRLDPAIQI